MSAPGVAGSALIAALAGRPGLGVAGRADGPAAQNDAGAQIGYVTLGLIIAFTAIAVLNTLAMTISDRGRELAALRLVGATRRQVRRMLAWETAVVVTVATLLGLGIAGAVLTAYADGMTGMARPSVPGAQLAMVVGGGVVLAAVATGLPARAALRIRER